MAVNFDIQCSIYRDVKDNYGRFVDCETGECIQSLTIREFCLTDRWKPVVDRLRDLRRVYGAQAKKMDEYTTTKAMLPGATLSGLFAIKDVYNEKSGRTETKSRITANLAQHTGFLCIDIDAQDNCSLGDMAMVLRTLRHRTEVALLMRSCSGTGYFALIPLAYPDRHKQQFAALLHEYAALGINLDRQCGDVTRVRFASYDEHPYINVNAIPYDGLKDTSIAPALAPKTPVYGRMETEDDLIGKVERLVQKLEYTHTDITENYDDWYRVGFALANLPGEWGRHFFMRVSAINPNFNQQEAEYKFSHLQNPARITIGTFFSMCRDRGITLK